ncbi:MAG: hypothetical protein QM767_03790 [Anaeromyxobacter sp.]
MEHALYRYGNSQQLERMGHRQFRASFDTAGMASGCGSTARPRGASTCSSS